METTLPSGLVVLLSRSKRKRGTADSCFRRFTNFLTDRPYLCVVLSRGRAYVRDSCLVKCFRSFSSRTHTPRASTNSRVTIRATGLFTLFWYTGYRYCWTLSLDLVTWPKAVARQTFKETPWIYLLIPFSSFVIKRVTRHPEFWPHSLILVLGL